jgi:hypothetical protein
MENAYAIAKSCSDGHCATGRLTTGSESREGWIRDSRHSKKKTANRVQIECTLMIGKMKNGSGFPNTVVVNDACKCIMNRVALGPTEWDPHSSVTFLNRNDN